MLPFTLADVIVGFLITWVLGLAPAIIARRKKQGPLRRGDANAIAATSCVCFALLFFFVKLALGVPHPRFSAAWIIVFFVARWIMVRPSNERESQILAAASPQPAGAPVSERALTRQEMVQKLEELVRHPSTSDEHRVWARSKLDAFNKRTERVPRQSDPSRPRRYVITRVRRAHLRKAAYVLLTIVAIDGLVAASGLRLLLHEKVVQPGESYEARDWGDLGSYGKPVLACWYWTGRSLIPEAFWYGHRKHDRDECSVVHKHKPGE